MSVSVVTELIESNNAVHTTYPPIRVSVRERALNEFDYNEHMDIHAQCERPL